MSNIIYSRVSTNSQGPESIEVQNTICLNFLNSNGIVLNNSYSEVTSAFNGKQKILENIIKNTKNATIYVKNVSRLSRNITNGLKFIEEAKKNNINFFFIDENVSTSNETHSHIIRMKISEAQFESETIGKRARDSNKVRKAQGHKFGKAPFGYKAVLKKGIRKFEKDQLERKVTDFIVQARTGTSSSLLNSKLKKIVASPAPIYFYDEEGNVIENFAKPNTLKNFEVADLLNDYHIKNRNKDWTPSSVSSIFNKEIKYENMITEELKNELTI